MIQRRHIGLMVYAILLVLMMFGIEAGLPVPGLSLKNALLYILLTLLSIEGIIARRGQPLKLESIHFLFLALIAYGTLSWLTTAFVIDYSGYRLVSAFVALKAQLADKYILLLVFFYLLQNARDARWVLERAVALVAIAQILGLIDHFDVPDLGILDPWSLGRFAGIVREPNQSGVYIIATLPLMVAISIYAKGWLRAICVIGAAISMVSMIVGMSRGAFVSFIFGGFVGLFYLRKFINIGSAIRWFAAGVIVIAIGLFLVFLVSGDLFTDRVIERSTSGSLVEASSGRWRTWGSLLGIMLREPQTLLFGYGWNTYLLLNETGWSPHNTLLYLFFELGIIGVAMFVAILYLIASRLRKFVHSEKVTVEDRQICIGFLFGLYGLFVAILFTDVWAIWLLLFAQCGLALRISLGTDSEATHESLTQQRPADALNHEAGT